MVTPKRYTFVIVTVIILITVGVGARLYQLTRIKFDIDLMTDGLAPIKQELKRSTKIGYVTDIPSDGTYNEVAFVLAPVVLSKDSLSDTLLYVHNGGSPIKTFVGYDIIANSAAQHYQFTLLKKKR